LEDNYDKDKEAFSLVEVALFMKSSYSEGEDAKKLTDEDYKEMQIDNYVSQINQNTIRVEKMEIALKEPKKQVWIITKGGNSKTRSIKEKERVKIKEINIENLIELLSSKITNPRVDISDKLGRLGDME